MTIETLKLDNGEDFKIDTASNEYQSYINSASQIGITKNDESVFFARNLEFARQTAFKVNYSELKLLNGGLLPIDTSIPAGAEVDSYKIEDAVGTAKVVASYADDIGTVEILGKEVFNKIISIADSYVYSRQDARADQMKGGVGSSTLQRKAEAARRSIDQKLESILAFGEPTFNIKGLFNADGVPQNGVAGGGWAPKTSAQILDDVRKAIDAQVDLTKGMEISDTMILDNTSYSLIKLRELDTTNYSGMTILKYIETNYNLKVVDMAQIKNKFVGNTSGFVLYKNDSQKVQGVMPIRLEAHAPQVHNLVTKNILEARCGGTRVYHPLSVSVTYGI